MNQGVGDCNNNERIYVGLTPMQEFYSGKNIFITGGTGEFLINMKMLLLMKEDLHETCCNSLKLKQEFVSSLRFHGKNAY